jgi:hypothetical protein
MDDNILKRYHEARGYGSTAKQALYQAKLGAALAVYFTSAYAACEPSTARFELPDGCYLTCKLEHDDHGDAPWEQCEAFGTPEQHRDWEP